MNSLWLREKPNGRIRLLDIKFFNSLVCLRMINSFDLISNFRPLLYVIPVTLLGIFSGCAWTTDATNSDQPTPPDVKVESTRTGFYMSTPVGCQTGVDCWVISHFDHDKTAEASDYRCGQLTFNKFPGTGIGLSNRGEIHKTTKFSPPRPASSLVSIIVCAM
jgi:hypothetical protein